MARLSIDDAAWSSRWRRRSVTEKAVLSLGLLSVAMVTRDWRIDLAVVVIALLAVTVLARVPLKLTGRALLLPGSFIVVGLLGVLISIGTPAPDALAAAGPFWIDPASVERALVILGRCYAALAAVMVLALTTPMSHLLAWLQRIGVPAVMIEVAALIYRMLFTLMDTLVTIREGQHARLGYASPAKALRSTGALFSTVLLQSWLRAQRLEAGLAGRGYDGTLQVTVRTPAVSRAFLTGSALVVSSLLVMVVLTR